MQDHPETKTVGVRCTSCGAAFSVRSTAPTEIVVDICSRCHPAYTGGSRPASGGSRIDRFNRRRARAAA